MWINQKQNYFNWLGIYSYIAGQYYINGIQQRKIGLWVENRQDFQMLQNWSGDIYSFCLFSFACCQQGSILSLSKLYTGM